MSGQAGASLQIRRPTPESVPATVGSLIAGQACGADGARVAVYDPATATVVTHIAEAAEQTVARAVAAARDSYASGIWSRAPIFERQRLLYAAAESIRASAAELAALESLCNGTPVLRSSYRQISSAAEWLQYFGERLGSWHGMVYQQVPQTTTLVTFQPRGVAALFAPWNVPVGLALVKLSAAIACGNSVVLKASEQTPLATLRLVELLHEAGLPPGVVNLLNGRGQVTGAALADAPGVDCISFTGGAAGGRAVARAAADRVIPCLLELGGKSAFIVFSDADMESTVSAAVLAAFGNNGQACLAGSRLLVERQSSGAFLKALIERTQSLQVGDPFDGDTDIGPIASRNHLDFLQGFVAKAARDGAKLLHGGETRQDLSPGWYMDPAIATVQRADHSLAQDEIFGPILTVIEFDTEEEAWRIANGTRYGLVAYVFTNDHQRVQRAIRALDAGTVLINSAMVRERNAPFGGFRESGVGSEGGDFSMRFFSQEKTVVMPLRE